MNVLRVMAAWAGLAAVWVTRSSYPEGFPRYQRSVLALARSRSTLRWAGGAQLGFDKRGGLVELPTSRDPPVAAGRRLAEYTAAEAAVARLPVWRCTDAKAGVAGQLHGEKNDSVVCM
jgi:hypothetical protein